MGKLHKIRRYLRDKRKRDDVRNFYTAIIGGRRCPVYRWNAARSHEKYIKKIIREYSDR